MEVSVVRNLRSNQLARGDNVVDLATFKSAQNPTRVVKAMYRKVMDNTKSTDYSLLQGTRPNGHLRLVEILAKMYSKLINRLIDPYTEILTTSGPNHAMTCAILTLVQPGTEVIVMEPCLESYIKLIISADAIPRFATFKKLYNVNTDSYELFLDDKLFESLFSENTSTLVLNNPNSPTGKVFTLFELDLIAYLCIKWNVICISDEVYEWQVYEPRHHFRIASLPKMWERTVTIGSGGHSFGVTGWAVGWLYGPACLMPPLNLMHNLTVFSGSALMEETIARLLEKEFRLFGKEASQFKLITRQMERKRNFIFKALKMVNFEPILPWAGAFLLVDWSDLETRVDLSSETGKYKDFLFTKWLARRVGIQGVPATPFFSEGNRNFMQNHICFCFVNNISNLNSAKKKLKDTFLKKGKNCLWYQSKVKKDKILLYSHIITSLIPNIL